jgi:hypothetical protein
MQGTTFAAADRVLPRAETSSTARRGAVVALDGEQLRDLTELLFDEGSSDPCADVAAA